MQDIQPTTRPRINFFQVSAGWAAFYCSLCFFLLFLCLLELFRLYMQKLNKTRQKQQKQKNNKTTQRKTNKQTNIQDILQPTTRPQMNIFQVPAGWVFFLKISFFFFYFA